MLKWSSECLMTYESLGTITITLENTYRSDPLSACSNLHTSTVFRSTDSHSHSSSAFLHDPRYSVTNTSLAQHRTTSSAYTIDSVASFITFSVSTSIIIIYTIILLKSVCLSVCLSVTVSKLQVAILARSSRKMSQTARIC